MMAQAVEEWNKQMPIITRSYVTAAIVTTVGCSLDTILLLRSSIAFCLCFSVLIRLSVPFAVYMCQSPYKVLRLRVGISVSRRTSKIISPYHLYLNPRLVVKQYEFWRLITNFFYFSRMDMDFLFHMFFLAWYCKLLEENSFRGRTADFFYMLLFGATLLTGIFVGGGMIPYMYGANKIPSSTSFLGPFTFTTAYLPWVLLGFSVLVGASAWGMIADHAYYFLEHVYPRMSGQRPLRTPSFITALFADEPVMVVRPAHVRFAPPQAEAPHHD